MRYLINAAKCLATCIVIVLVLFALLIWCSRIPSDSQVQKRFNRDRGTIAILLNKLSQEPSNIIGVTKDKVMVDDTANWVSPEKAGFSSEHFTEYKVLMDKARVMQLWRSDGETEFGIAGSGFASYGWRLSFAHRISAPATLVPSIDRLPKLTSEDRGVVYQPLGDNWYIRLIY